MKQSFSKQGLMLVYPGFQNEAKIYQCNRIVEEFQTLGIQIDKIEKVGKAIKKSFVHLQIFKCVKMAVVNVCVDAEIVFYNAFHFVHIFARKIGICCLCLHSSLLLSAGNKLSLLSCSEIHLMRKSIKVLAGRLVAVV